MKNLIVIEDPLEADRICALLEERGIPVSRMDYDPADRTGRGNLFHAISVCLDSQYDDALAVLQNPSHEPENPVDIDAYRVYVENDKDKTVLNYLLWPSLAIIAVALAVFGFAYYFGMFGYAD